MLSPSRTPAFPPALDKSSFLQLVGMILAASACGSQFSHLSRIYLNVMGSALVAQHKQIDAEVHAWIREAVMTRLVSHNEAVFNAFEDKLDGDPKWWPMVNAQWGHACGELARDIESELPKYLGGRPGYAQDKLDALREAIVMLTPEDIFDAQTIADLRAVLQVFEIHYGDHADKLGNAIAKLVADLWPTDGARSSPDARRDPQMQEGDLWDDVNMPEQNLLKKKRTPVLRKHIGRRSLRSCARPAFQTAGKPLLAQKVLRQMLRRSLRRKTCS